MKKSEGSPFLLKKSLQEAKRAEKVPLPSSAVAKFHVRVFLVDQLWPPKSTPNRVLNRHGALELDLYLKAKIEKFFAFSGERQVPSLCEKQQDTTKCLRLPRDKKSKNLLCKAL